MGHGIAHVCATAGFEVDLHDLSTELIDKGLASIRRNLDKGVEKGKVAEEDRDAALDRLHAAPDLAAAVARADMVIEAAPESLELKRELFRDLDRTAREHTILASNTSSLPVGKIAEATGRPERVVGMHYFNPVHLMPLLEIVRAERTSSETIDAVVAAGTRMGKDPIVVRDSPGFASSRLGLVLGLEAMRMLEQEVASAEDIDKAMTLGYRHPMGPLRLTDLVGLDVRLAIAEHLHRELDSDSFRPPEILRRMVAEGRLGKKSGRGFYDWGA
ncbi:MAG: 3-hydroxyacyl-CoA dehydrogenase family protein [bacterium]|nr:3-hydroxyacyl-CoA dehydrogenase family protein [bacterium]